jgi:isoleucyl-tRNA synthetase
MTILAPTNAPLFRAINPFIRKQMEQMRHDKIIGSSLDGEVDIYCDDNTYKLLEKLGDEFW